MTCPYPDGCTNTVTTTTTTVAKATHQAFAYTGDWIALWGLLALFVLFVGLAVYYFTRPIDHKKGY